MRRIFQWRWCWYWYYPHCGQRLLTDLISISDLQAPTTKTIWTLLSSSQNRRSTSKHAKHSPVSPSTMWRAAARLCVYIIVRPNKQVDMWKRGGCTGHNQSKVLVNQYQNNHKSWKVSYPGDGTQLLCKVPLTHLRCKNDDMLRQQMMRPPTPNPLVVPEKPPHHKRLALASFSSFSFVYAT